MRPEGDLPGYLNLWRGFAVQPKPGEWSRLQEHIFEVLCGAVPALYAYVLSWMAFGVQHPERPAEVALAIARAGGAGKDDHRQDLRRAVRSALPADCEHEALDRAL